MSQEPSLSAPWPSTRGTGVYATAQVIRAASAARSSGEPAGAHLAKHRSGPSPTSKVSACSFSQARHTGRAAASSRTAAGGIADRRGVSVLTRSRCHTGAQPGTSVRRAARPEPPGCLSLLENRQRPRVVAISTHLIAFSCAGCDAEGHPSAARGIWPYLQCLATLRRGGHRTPRRQHLAARRRQCLTAAALLVIAG